MDDIRSQDKPTDTSQGEAVEEALSRAVGKELRSVREVLGWSRLYFVGRLPSGICDRTLLAYEHGKRHMTLLRFLELCRALGVAAPVLLTQALQRARLELANLVLQVDLREVIRDGSPAFRPMARWARNKLNRYPNGVVELPPSSVEELADFMGYPCKDLAKYLAKFTPDTEAVYGIDQAETDDADRERW